MIVGSSWKVSHLVFHGVKGEGVVQSHHEPGCIGVVERLIVEVHPGLYGILVEVDGTGIDMQNERAGFLLSEAREEEPRSLHLHDSAVGLALLEQDAGQATLRTLGVEELTGKIQGRLPATDGSQIFQW